MKNPNSNSGLGPVLVRKLNVRAAALAIAALIAASGCLMIFQGIRDQGEIDIKSPFVSGKLKAGFVGVFLVFLSSIITTTVIMRQRSDKGPKQSIKVRRGDVEMEWDGDLYYWDESKSILDVVTAISEAAFGPVPNTSGEASNEQEGSEQNPQ